MCRIEPLWGISGNYTLLLQMRAVMRQIVPRNGDLLLAEFITTYRDAIIARARQKLTARPWPSASPRELQNGVPLFLTQLSETLQAASAGLPYSKAAIGSGATRHGRALLAAGFHRRAGRARLWRHLSSRDRDRHRAAGVHHHRRIQDAEWLSRHRYRGSRGRSRPPHDRGKVCPGVRAGGTGRPGSPCPARNSPPGLSDAESGHRGH